MIIARSPEHSPHARGFNSQASAQPLDPTEQCFQSETDLCTGLVQRGVHGCVTSCPTLTLLSLLSYSLFRWWWHHSGFSQALNTQPRHATGAEGSTAPRALPPDTHSLHAV